MRAANLDAWPGKRSASRSKTINEPRRTSWSSRSCTVDVSSGWAARKSCLSFSSSIWAVLNAVTAVRSPLTMTARTSSDELPEVLWTDLILGRRDEVSEDAHLVAKSTVSWMRWSSAPYRSRASALPNWADVPNEWQHNFKRFGSLVVKRWSLPASREVVNVSANQEATSTPSHSIERIEEEAEVGLRVRVARREHFPRAILVRAIGIDTVEPLP